MSWRDRIGPAKFRGVAFYVDTSERVGGRRVVDHEFPFKDDAPYVEDLGRRGRTFPIEGYVLGADYISARDALIGELEKSGPGELSHPYYGVLRVAVESYRVRETRQDGGMAVFSIDFRETSTAPTKPTVVTDAGAQLKTTAASAKTAVGVEFLAKYDPSSRLTSGVVGALRSAANSVNSILAVSAMASQTSASLSRRITNLTNDVASLANDPEELLASQVELFEALTDGLQTSPVTRLLSLFSFDPGDRPSGDTDSGLIAQTNFDATQYLVQRLALIQASLVAIEQTYDSFDAAVAARVAITDLLDEHLDAVSDDTYLNFQALRADLVKAVPGDDQDLPRLNSVTLRATTPSLVLAHTLYGHLDKEADLVARNNIKNPGFIPGGTSLEILSE